MNTADIMQTVVITKARSNYLSRESDTTDCDMHKANAEIMAQLYADIIVLQLGIRDAIQDVKDQDYGIAIESLERAQFRSNVYD